MIQANPKKTLAPLIGVLIAGLLLWVWNPKEKTDETVVFEGDTTYYLNQGNVFGTTYHIRYEATRDLQSAIDSALQCFDNSLSMFNPHSVLSVINANRDTVTDESFEQMFMEAIRINELSHGAFDISVAPLVNYWGFGRRVAGDGYPSSVNHQTIDSILSFVGFDKVQLVDHRVIKTDPRVMLDAGAVAKGQSCDMVAEVLGELGCTNYLVEIGGEVVAHGHNVQGQPWSIGISKPNLNNEGAQKDYQEILHLTDACLATSGNYRNFYYDGDVRRSHTIDPRTGYPVQHSLLSATVISSSCMRADALATSCMVLGVEDAMEMIKRAEDAACFFIVAQNDSLMVITSPNWTDLVTK